MKPTSETQPRVSESSDTPPPAPARSGRTIGIAVVSLIVVGTAAYLAGRQNRPPGAAPQAAAELQTTPDAVELSASAPQWKFIELDTARTGLPLAPVPAPARVIVDEAREAPVFAPLAGRVEEVAVQLGQLVKAGTKLVSIRSATLPELGREIESARAVLAVRSTAAERVRDLVKLGAVPEKDMLLAEEERKQAELALKAAEGKRTSLHIGSVDPGGLYWIASPRSGIVVERAALVGQEVGPDRQEALAKVADLTEVIVVADVLEHDIASVAVGQKARITAASLGEASVEGTVAHVADLVDPVRRTVAVRLRVPNPEHRLRPNAFARVSFPAGEGQRIVIPSDAVVTDGERNVVFVKTAGSKGLERLVRRIVRTGRTRDGSTEILEGLSPGDQFVVRGAILLLNSLTIGR